MKKGKKWRKSAFYMDRKVIEKPIFSKKIAKNPFQRRKNEK